MGSVHEDERPVRIFSFHKIIQEESYVGVVGKFHVLCEPKSLDGGDITNIKEPDICQHIPLEDESGHNATEDINIDLHIGGPIHKSKLGQC